MLDLAMAVAGVLMFGDSVHNEITWNVVSSGDYPHVLSVCIVIFVAIVPLTKIPLR
jgi:vesicular inhibitory amino acid transporter